MTDTPVVDARALTKRFGKVEALAGLDLTVAPGQVTALLGPNGAGKTTFVRTLATLVRPDAGTVSVCGHDVVRSPAAVRRLIGLAGQSAAASALARLDESAAPVVDAATRRVSVAVSAGTDRLVAAARLLEDGGVAVDDIALRRPTLDEVFLALTGQGVSA